MLYYITSNRLQIRNKHNIKYLHTFLCCFFNLLRPCPLVPFKKQFLTHRTLKMSATCSPVFTLISCTSWNAIFWLCTKQFCNNIYYETAALGRLFRKKSILCIYKRINLLLKIWIRELSIKIFNYWLIFTGFCVTCKQPLSWG